MKIFKSLSAYFKRQPTVTYVTNAQLTNLATEMREAAARLNEAVVAHEAAAAAHKIQAERYANETELLRIAIHVGVVRTKDKVDSFNRRN